MADYHNFRGEDVDAPSTDNVYQVDRLIGDMVPTRDDVTIDKLYIPIETIIFDRVRTGVFQVNNVLCG